MTRDETAYKNGYLTWNVMLDLIDDEGISRDRLESVFKMIDEQHTKDLQEFTEWCSKNGWTYNGNDYHLWNKIGENSKHSSWLQNQWEVETGRRKG